MKKIITTLVLIAVILVASGGQVQAAQSTSTQPIPTFVILAVDRDDVVTIQTDNLRLEDTYIVTMGPMGTKGMDGTQVGTIETSDSGRLVKTFKIPSNLKGSYQISIRLESPQTGYFAYNWFYNADANLDLNGDPVTSPVVDSTSYSGYPYFYIKSVAADASVTITPYNFPPNDTFVVRMNWMNTRGVAGAIVETVTTDSKGKLSDTSFNIPDFLIGSERIAIRLQSSTSGYYAYNWFYNNDAP